MLELVNHSVALLPHFLRNKVLYANDQDILVLRAVEDGDHAAWRRLLVIAPEEIMVQLFASRHLKRPDLTSLWIDPFEHTADRTVFPTGIHCLEDDQQALLMLGVEPLL